jgi:hypothetical protein
MEPDQGGSRMNQSDDRLVNRRKRRWRHRRKQRACRLVIIDDAAGGIVAGGDRGLPSRPTSAMLEWGSAGGIATNGDERQSVRDLIFLRLRTKSDATDRQCRGTQHMLDFGIPKSSVTLPRFDFRIPKSNVRMSNLSDAGAESLGNAGAAQGR